MSRQGCLKGRGTDLVSLFTSLAMALERMSDHAIMYAALDIKSAFYIVLRELLLPLPTSSDDLQQLLEDLEVPLLFQQPFQTAATTGQPHRSLC